MKPRSLTHRVSPLLDLFTVGARTSLNAGSFQCDQCLTHTQFPVVWEDSTFCLSCWDGKVKPINLGTPAVFTNSVCECGAEKSGSLGHSDWCPKYRRTYGKS